MVGWPLRTEFSVTSCRRAAIAPFLANVTLGSDSYSWILYGDDDTFFNVEAALRMVNGLNDTQPYLLTDNVWFPAKDGARSLRELVALRMRRMSKAIDPARIRLAR